MFFKLNEYNKNLHIQNSLIAPDFFFAFSITNFTKANEWFFCKSAVINLKYFLYIIRWHVFDNIRLYLEF